MIVRARAPLRLGLAGGGSDLSPFCDEHGGFVLNATINLFVYAILEPRTDGRVRFIAADRRECVDAEATGDLPLDGDLALHRGVYRRIMQDFNGGNCLPVTLTTYSDVAAGSGLGSSSTLVVAMVEAFKEMLSLPLGEYEVAQLAYRIERQDVGFTGGKQDQYAAAFGGFNFMEFYADNRVIVNPLRIKPPNLHELEASLVLYNTGMARDAETIIAEQTAGLRNRAPQAVDAMKNLKLEAVAMKEALLKGNIRALGQVLKDGWENKKRTAAQVSNPIVDRIFERAMSAGAYAGKVSGAGGGGFMMFVADPLRRSDVCRALAGEDGTVMNAHFTDQGSIAWRAR
jgi:D-glycero-alpha-D-manno-heptose-7-phosphate kinase